MEHSEDVSNYRYEKATQCLATSKAMIALNDYKGAANRSYYCVFHAMRSVLALDNVDYSNHGQVMGYFRREYIKTKIFPVKMSDILTVLFDVRNKSDYDDFYIVSKEDVTNQLKSAEFFLDEIRKYLGCTDNTEYLIEPDTSKTPVLGRLNGTITIPHDFDEPLEEMKEYMF